MAQWKATEDWGEVASGIQLLWNCVITPLDPMEREPSTAPSTEGEISDDGSKLLDVKEEGVPTQGSTPEVYTSTA